MTAEPFELARGDGVAAGVGAAEETGDEGDAGAAAVKGAAVKVAALR